MKQEKAIIDHPENLLSEFEDTSYDEWLEIAEKSLKGKPFDKIIKKSLEGFEIRPIYTQKDAQDLIDSKSFPGVYPYQRGINVDGYINKKWDITQEIKYPVAEMLNDALENDLHKGQSAICLSLDELSKQGKNSQSSELLFKNGTSIFTSDDYDKLLKNINITHVPIFINAGLSSFSQLALFITSLKKMKIDVKNIQGGLFFDPISIALDQENSDVNIEKLYENIKSIISWKKSKMGLFKVIAVDSTIYSESGSDIVQEVAFSLSAGTNHIRTLMDNDLSIDDIANNIFFNVAFGPSFFLEIAKMRAIRKLWAKIVQEFGGSQESRKLHLFARTSQFNKSNLDQYTNLLRNTTEALSAILSDCQQLHVGYFDEGYGLPNEFSRRISRNTQLVLMEECNIPEVIDPVGGTWYVEILTEQIAERAWDLFQKIEDMGGLKSAIEDNFVQDLINEKSKIRIEQISIRKNILVGTNKYPNSNEKDPKPLEYDKDKLSKERIDKSKNLQQKIEIQKDISFEEVIYFAQKGATLNDLFSTTYQESENSIKALKKLRLTDEFEKIRDWAKDYKNKNGHYPQIHLANIGSVRDYKARADFAYDFFSVGGLQVISEYGNDNWEEAAKSAIKSDSKIIVICSTDDKYREFVPQFTRLVKRVKPMNIIILAGYPEEDVDEYKAAGIDQFIHIRSNIVEVLSYLYKELSL